MKRARSEGKLDGQTALVTGGGTGIGRSIALAFAREGCNVVVCGRRMEVLSAVCDEAEALGGGYMKAMQCDQADEAAVGSTVTAARAALGGRIDVLVLNAGRNVTERTVDVLSNEDWRAVLDVNLNGPWYFCQAALPTLREQGGGTIINVSSICGLRALDIGGAAYCASKAGLNALGNMINLEEAKNGIRCTNLCPGEVDTPILDRRPVPPTAERRKQMAMPDDLGEVALMIATLPPRVFIPTITVTGITTLELSM
jgi:NAD(P)-dependent dehydrogenase (short-subunit alcohol dehydrogenase family)